MSTTHTHTHKHTTHLKLPVIQNPYNGHYLVLLSTKSIDRLAHCLQEVVTDFAMELLHASFWHSWIEEEKVGVTVAEVLYTHDGSTVAWWRRHNRQIIVHVNTDGMVIEGHRTVMTGK